LATVAIPDSASTVLPGSTRDKRDINPPRIVGTRASLPDNTTDRADGAEIARLATAFTIDSR
jgi:hypothetical protein